MENKHIQEHISTICKSGDEVKIEKLNKMIGKLIFDDNSKSEGKDVSHKVFWKTREILHGNELTKELVENAVKCMLPYGEAWSLNDTEAHMNRSSIKCALFDFYYVANMLYNMSDSFKENYELLTKVAIDWINDRNSKQTKTYEFIKHISLYGNYER